MSFLIGRANLKSLKKLLLFFVTTHFIIDFSKFVFKTVKTLKGEE